MNTKIYLAHIWRFFLILLMSSVIGGCLLYAYGLRFNFTASMPRGVYLVEAVQPQKGDMVAFCLPAVQAEFAYTQGYLQQGTCTSGVQGLLKILGGVAGDIVITKNNTIQVGDVILPIYGTDQLGRLLIQELQAGVIPEGKAFVYAPYSRSYDSRYFGLVPRASLQKVRRLYP